MSTAEKTVKKPKEKKNIGTIIVDVILIIAIVFAAVVAFSSFMAKRDGDLPNLFGIRMSRVLTPSMSPTFNVDDMIFTKSIKDPAKLEEGDIITFWTILDGMEDQGRQANTHRILSIMENGDGSRTFVTKGDNNTQADSKIVGSKELIGQYMFRIPKLGGAFEFMQTSTGFAICIVVPVALFFIWQLVQFFIALFAYQKEKSRIELMKQLGQPIPAEEGEVAPAPEAKPEAAEKAEPEKKE